MTTIIAINRKLVKKLIILKSCKESNAIKPSDGNTGELKIAV
jgi:hypothetical protein